MTIRNPYAPHRRALGDVLVVGVLAAVTAVVSGWALWRITGNFSNDIIPHANLAVEYVESGHLFTYSLWYPLIWVATGGGDPAYFRVASVGLLWLFVMGKAAISYVIAQSIHRSAWSSGLIAFGVTFFGPLVDPANPKDIYLGQITATVWHNSTNIMVAPFALLAFWASARLVEVPTWQRAGVAGAATALAVAIKPNYALAMIPVIAVALVASLIRTRTGLARGFGVAASAAIPPIVILALQFASMYGGGLGREESLVVAPLAAWRNFSDNIPWSIVLSLLGVVVALIALIIRRGVTPDVVLAWSVLGVAIVELCLLAEQMSDGSLANSGNWFWGAYTALMVLVLWSATALRGSMLEATTKRHLVPLAAAAAALALHVLCGVYYALVVGTTAYGAF